jgi:lysine 2,3-aminomutase
MPQPKSLDEDSEPPGSSPTVLTCPETLAQTTLPARGKRRPRAVAPPARDATHEPVSGLDVIPATPQRTSDNSRRFRQQFFPQATTADWCDWQWQIRHRIRSLELLEQILRLSAEEREALTRHECCLPLAVTPYYASLLDPDNPNDPLRRTVIPVTTELKMSLGEAVDPLDEDASSPVPGLVHRYPDRVLFLVTGFCSTYCRFCTRSRLVGHGDQLKFDTAQWQAALEYIRRTPAVRDVLLSGGDPLTLPDERLEWLLLRLRQIPHVEIIRIGTKVPAVLPQRVTPALIRMLKRYHPLWLSLHFTHPDELTPETTLACTRLADAGIPLGSQTVLLAGVNDNVETMTRLMQGLLKIRVRPYYLYQCDPIVGSVHLRTPVEKGLEIIRGLRGHTSGYAVPHYVIDAPGGGGKIPLLPEYYAGREGDDVVLRNFQGRTFRYPDAVADAGPVAAPDCT